MQPFDWLREFFAPPDWLLLPPKRRRMPQWQARYVVLFFMIAGLVASLVWFGLGSTDMFHAALGR